MDSPSWVGPTVAVSLVVTAASLFVMSGVALTVMVQLRRQSRALRAAITSFSNEAKAITAKLRGELDGYVAISEDARSRLRGAITAVDSRLRDLDALVEVLQEEAEETALDTAAFLRTIRRTGGVIGAARRRLARRRQRKG